MRSLFIENQLPRLRRVSTAFASILLVVSGYVLACRILQIDGTLPFGNAVTAVHSNSAAAFFILAVALLGYETDRREFTLLAIVPGALGLIGLVQFFLPVNFGVDALMMHDAFNPAGSPTSMHPVAALCLLLTSGVVVWLYHPPFSQKRVIAVALAASVLSSVGFSSILGYELALPAVYRWGTGENLPPGTAGLLFVLGSCLLMISWREQQRIQAGPPAWLPMPFVIGSATLTCILWLGLREVETVRVATTTQIALRDFATAISRELQHGEDAVEQLAQLEAQATPSAEAWRSNARAVRGQVSGVQAVYRLSSTFQTLEIDPTAGNEPFQFFDHGSDPARRTTLERARNNRRAETSATVRNAAGAYGIAIYAPIIRSNELTGFIGAEFSYHRFFAMLERALKLGGNYHTRILVGAEPVYESGRAIEASPENLIEEVFDIADRRVQIEMAPTWENLRSSRGYLPELALGAGWGITLLLGLSVHLARSARTSLRTAQRSNEKLLAENEERRRIEEQLRLSQANTRKLSLVASKTDNLVVIASATGLIEWVNESFEQAMEYSLAEVVGRSPAEFMVGPETSAGTVRRIKAAIGRGRSISTDLTNYSKSGKKYHLHLEVQPVHNDQGTLENFIAVQVDITARVEMEQNLRRAKAEADAASRAKSGFLASMSHEIRTPMNGVIGMTSLLLDTGLTPDQRDCVNTIRNSGDALLTIINEILDFSKIESGKMELEHLPFELAICIEDCLDLFSVQAAKQKLELAYFIEPTVPGWIQGDVSRLRQVLVNLVNNAVKFTPSGSVAVKVSCNQNTPTTDGRNDRVALEFSVIDTGIGIAPDRIDRLFRPFSQVDSSTTRKYGGTGLGLAISQRLCQLMGGTISVNTAVGRGATFKFTINVEPVNTPLGWGMPDLPARLRFGQVLCVQKHPITQSRLQAFLSLWGASPLCVSDPRVALEQLDRQPPPIAVIFDQALIDAPGGMALRERLSQGETPALLLLPTGESADSLAIFAGRRGIATASKPLRTHALIRGLQSLFESPTDSLPPFVIPADTHLLGHEIPLDILLVEDNSVNQKVALRFLDRLGYRADAVANGMEALNTLETRHYHLVLMDLQMPEMDGFAAARAIRARVAPDKQPKIIALTANALHGDRDQCFAAGMDDYITKPVKILDIAQAIRRQFSLGSRSPLRG